MSNKLVNEKSPYLLQHSENPVNWYPWGDEAINKAKSENKPIFLSIGYSSCYWCHVMEREVFENVEIASLMNEYFVNIKVDREERPDIDKIYMTALQSMTGMGGWPLNMFLTPDLKPFYGATYIPPREKYGRAGFEDIIKKITELWSDSREEIITSSEKITGILSKTMLRNPSDVVSTEKTSDLFEKLFEQCEGLYDEENGGFGTGNKFPRPVLLNLLVAYYYEYGNVKALDMVTYTLKKMFEGGIYDRLRGGFHRYSVDIYWRVPHFEKMLYDQAQLAELYFDAFLVSNERLFVEAGTDILNYMENYLKNQDGAYFSSEDAESLEDRNENAEKKEGEYYLWDWEEVRNLAGKNADVIMYHFGIMHGGNTIYDPHNVFGSKNVLYIANDVYSTSKKFNITHEEVQKIIKDCSNKMLIHRNKKPKPGLDNKVLTSWNALAISALTKAFRVTGKDSYLKSALKTADFIIEKLYDKVDKILYHRYCEGEVKFKGTLEDYSYFIKALIQLYEISFELKYLDLALELNELVIDKFYDKENGGFFNTESNEKDIILRIKDIYDGAEPSGNSIQLLNILYISKITGDKNYLKYFENTFSLYYDEIKKMPFSYPNMLYVLLLSALSFREIIFTGDKNSQEVKDILRYINEKYLPDKVILNACPQMSDRFEYLKKMELNSLEIKFYVCKNYSCKLPVSDLNSIKKLI